MNFLKLAAAGILSLALFSPAHASDVSLSPVQNYSIGNVDSDMSPFVIYGGGTQAGGTNWGDWEIFTQFKLPTAVAGASVTHAELVLHATSSSDPSAQPLGVYVVANSWNLDNMSIDGYPRPYWKQPPVASFHVDSGEDAHVDLTSFVNTAYHGDGYITLVIANNDYYENYQNFDRSKSLNLTISAVPEPATYGMLLAGLAILALRAHRKQQR